MGARVASHGEDCRSSAGSDCGEDRAGASPSDYGNHCTSSNDLNASTGGRNDRTDANANANDYDGGANANDYYGCPYGGDHLPCNECTNDNHGNDNHGCWLRAVTNNFVGQLTMPKVVGSFDYEFWCLCCLFSHVAPVLRIPQAALIARFWLFIIHLCVRSERTLRLPDLSHIP